MQSKVWIDVFYLLLSDQVVGIFTDRDKAEKLSDLYKGSISEHAGYYTALNYLKKLLPMDEQMEYNIWEKKMGFDIAYRKGFKSEKI